jgi:hypothetical protein
MSSTLPFSGTGSDLAFQLQQLERLVKLYAAANDLLYPSPPPAAYKTYESFLSSAPSAPDQFTEFCRVHGVPSIKDDSKLQMHLLPMLSGDAAKAVAHLSYTYDILALLKERYAPANNVFQAEMIYQEFNSLVLTPSDDPYDFYSRMSGLVRSYNNSYGGVINKITDYNMALRIVMASCIAYPELSAQWNVELATNTFKFDTLAMIEALRQFKMRNNYMQTISAGAGALATPAGKLAHSAPRPTSAKPPGFPALPPAFESFSFGGPSPTGTSVFVNFGGGPPIVGTSAKASKSSSSEFGSKKNKKEGCCIRCSKTLPFNEAKPLCLDCYKSWSRYQNPAYQEKYCHVCTRRASGITIDFPCCDDCDL